MIYLDNAATTKPSIEAIKSAERILTENFYNPSSTCQVGIDCKKIIETSREKIAKTFPSVYEVVFTGSGSEADNTAIFSFARRGNAITTLGEHSAVYESFKEIKKRGIEVRFASLNEDGSVNVDGLLSLVDDKTSFVSVVHVNNETGAINDINAIAKKIKAKNDKVIFHSDGVQAYQKIPYMLNEAVDLYSISAHKINGLKGVGALVKRKKISLNPLIFGGGQENGIRSGTENVYGIDIFASVTVSHTQNLRKDYAFVKELKKLFIDNLDKDNVKIISKENSSPYILSLSAVGLRGEVIMHMMEEFGVIIGTGSACSSRNRFSRILKECGFDNSVLDGALRISFSRDNTKEEILYSVEKLNECIKKLKGIMYK